MNKAQRENYQMITLLDAAKALLDSAGGCPGKSSCLRCEHFEPPATCQKFNLQIPDECKGDGCGDFQPFIPF